MKIKALAMVSQDKVVSPLYYQKESEILKLMNQICDFETGKITKRVEFIKPSAYKKFFILKEIN